MFWCSNFRMICSSRFCEQSNEVNVKQMPADTQVRTTQRRWRQAHLEAFVLQHFLDSHVLSIVTQLGLVDHPEGAIANDLGVRVRHFHSSVGALHRDLPGCGHHRGDLATVLACKSPENRNNMTWSSWQATQPLWLLVIYVKSMVVMSDLWRSNHARQSWAVIAANMDYTCRAIGCLEDITYAYHIQTWVTKRQ